jgi:hypothetical protein
MRRKTSVDDILAFIATKDKITIQEIKKTFRLDYLIICMILEFLVRFDLAKLDGHYVTLAKASMPLVKELILK